MRHRLTAWLHTWWGRGLLFSLVIAVLMAVLDPLFAISLPRPTRLDPRPGTPTARPPTATARPAPSPTPRPPTPTPPEVSTRPTYDLEVRYDFLSQQVEVREDIAYTNDTGWPLEDLVLVAQPRWYPGVLRLDGAWWHTPAGEWDALEPEMREMSVRLPLPSPLRPGETLRLRVRYRLNLPALRTGLSSGLHAPRTLGYTSRQVLWSDWYLFVPPYDPRRGWQVNTPWYVGENLVYPLSDVQVALEVYNPPPDLTIVTNATAQPCADPARERLCYRMEATRGVVFVFSPYFIRLERTLGQVRIEGYFFPLESGYGQDVLDAAGQALDTYAALFGPYHRDRYVVVQTDLSDGMEYDGLGLVSYDFFDYYNERPWSLLIAITVHETAHQWWFAQVHNDPALHPWLDESLAAYSEYLFYERLGDPVAVEWWWTYRVDYYDLGDTPIDRTIYEFDAWLPYRNTVYLRGVHFWHDLRQALGDDAFFAFLRDYRQTYQGRIVTPADWAAALARHTPSDVDLRALWARYFARPPRP